MGIIDDDLSIGNRGSDYINIGEALIELQNIDTLMVSLLEQLGLEDTIIYDTGDDVDLNDSTTWQDYLTKGRYTKKKRFWDYIFLQIINKGGVTNFVSPAEVTDAEVGARGNDYITKGELQKELLRTTAIIEFLSENANNIGDIDYNTLMNKPLINSIRLVGNKTASDLGLVDKTDLDTKADITELTKETTARVDKDAELENKILSLETKNINLENKDNDLETKISNEITNRENNYNELEDKITTINTDILAIENYIGDTTNLKTTSKIIVNAINELKQTSNNGNSGNTGTVYTAGNGIDITDDTISIDNTIVATKTDIKVLENSDNELEGKITTINTDIANIEYNIGDTTNLKTTSKIIVNAINEIKDGQVELDKKQNVLTAGEGLEIVGDNISAKKATHDVLGSVQVGEGLIANDGLLTIDKTKLPVLVYEDNSQSIPANTIVIHANDLFICKEDIASTSGWVIDEQKMEPVDTNTSEVNVVDYDQTAVGADIKRGQLVVHFNDAEGTTKLYIVKTTFTKVDYDTDKDNMIETALQVDLAEYYKSTQVDELLNQKASLVLPTITTGEKLTQNQLAISDNGELTRVKEDIASYVDEATDGSKLEAIATKSSVEIVKSELGTITTLTTNAKDNVIDAINELKKQVDLLKGASVDLIYPVGSIYLSMDDNFSPSTAFGGVWEKIQTGRYLQATDTGAGTQVAESLPNIKGTQPQGSSKALLAHPSISVNSNSLIGILSAGDNGKILYGSNGGGSAWAFLDFDASRACSTYQNGAKVQPNSIKVIMWKRIS